MQSSPNVLVIGAGPAGCSSAYDLAHAGKRVLLLDRRTFPRRKACACGLTRKTLAALRYSVEPVIERVCHEVILQQGSSVLKRSQFRIRARGAQKAQFAADAHTHRPICAMAVREVFDDFCLQQTLLSGRNGGNVTLLKIDGVLSLREFPMHVELDIATSEGPRTLKASVILGADGSNGQTRTLHDQLRTENREAPGWFKRGFALEATIPYAILSPELRQHDVMHDLVFDFSALSGGYGWLFPKGDHINIGIGVFAPDSTQGQLKQVNRQFLVDYIRHKLGLDLTMVDPAITHMTGQHLGMGGHHYIPQGRFLLLGDAAGLVDPLTGEGIHSAIVSGQAAAAAILSCEQNIAAAYAHRLAPLQKTLTFSHSVARVFYAQPERGFRLLRSPMVRNLVLKTYANGADYTRLHARLTKFIARA